MTTPANPHEFSMTADEATSIRARLTSKGVTDIPGLRKLADVLQRNDEPVVPTAAEFMEPLQSLVGLALGEEMGFVSALWLNGRTQEAVSRMKSPIGLSAIGSVMQRMDDAGVPLRNMTTNPPQQTIEAWADI